MGDPQPDTAAAAAAALVAKIDSTLLSLHSLESLVGAFTAEKQGSAQASFESAVQGLQDMEGLIAGIDGIEVPQKLLEWVDQGKDPDAFYQKLFEETLWLAQVCHCIAFPNGACISQWRTRCCCAATLRLLKRASQSTGLHKARTCQDDIT